MRTIDTKTAVMIVGGASWLKELLALLIKFRDALILDRNEAICIRGGDSDDTFIKELVRILGELLGSGLRRLFDKLKDGSSPRTEPEPEPQS